MSDVLIVGGGVIGLSLAYELARIGLSVRVLDAGEPGREASWAGAGILPPAPVGSGDPREQLFALSNQLHDQWGSALREETGIDNGFRRCGGLYVACEVPDANELNQVGQQWQNIGIKAHVVSSSQLADVEPALDGAKALSAWLLPDECQLRNPRHLRALLIACRRRGVEVVAGVRVEDFKVAGGKIASIATSLGQFSASHYCVTAGAWSSGLLSRLGSTTSVRPVRGQILLLNAGRRVLNRIVNDGPRYLVPREDGRLLVGSTEEEVGFDRCNTAAAIGELAAFAVSWAPALAEAAFERAWSGFRPATADGLPYLGRAPDISNGFVATGHFRNGLQLSTGTAVVMRQLMLGERTEIDLAAFRVDRPWPGK